MPFSWIHGTAILLAFLFLGCGGRAQHRSVPVRGKVVSRNGHPIGPVIIILWPENSKNNRMASAVSEVDGTFQLECQPGNYQVTVSPVRPKGATSPPSPQESGTAIPPRYQSELTTPLNVKVPETGDDSLILKLK